MAGVRPSTITPASAVVGKTDRGDLRDPLYSSGECFKDKALLLLRLWLYLYKHELGVGNGLYRMEHILAH